MKLISTEALFSTSQNLFTPIKSDLFFLLNFILQTLQFSFVIFYFLQNVQNKFKLLF